MPSHYLNQCIIVNWTFRNKVQSNCIRNSNIFIQENAFENIIWKMLAILSLSQCVKCYMDTYKHYTYQCTVIKISRKANDLGSRASAAAVEKSSCRCRSITWVLLIQIYIKGYLYLTLKIRQQGCYNMKISPYQSSDPHVKDKTISWPSYLLTWESPYLGKTVFIMRRGPGPYMVPEHQQYLCWRRSLSPKSLTTNLDHPYIVGQQK